MDLENHTEPGQRLRILFAAAGLLLATSAAIGKGAPALPFSTPAEQCIVPAAQMHGVNALVLRAILVVESNLNPGAVGNNDNKTTDVGIGQMNSMHFKELSRFGITPSHLKDACIGTYVAAWHLRKGISAGGNTWEAVARYHSGTPYFNNRYQILLKNELIRTGVLAGTIQRVPSR